MADETIEIKRDEETGRFLKARETDAPIAEVMARSDAAKEAAKAKTKEKAQKPEKEEAAPEPEKKVERDPKLAEAESRFFGEFLGEDKPKKPAKEEGDEPPPDKAKSAAAPDKAKAREKLPKAKVPPKAEAPAPMSQEQIVTAAAEAAARAIARKDEPAKDTGPQLTPAEQRKVSVLERMEKLYPEKCKDAAKRYRASQDKLAEYAKKWEAAHEGEQFDEDAEEHQPFFEKNDLYQFWEDDDYHEALADIRAEKRLEETNKTTNQRLSEIDRREKLREAQPQIVAEQTNAARKFWADQGDDFKDLISETGQVDHTKLKQLQEADPIVTAYRIRAAETLDNEVAATYALMNGLLAFDPKNRVHVSIGQFAESLEKALAASPAEDKTDSDGRLFLPSEAYYKVPAAEREEKYWTLGAKDIAFKRAQVLAVQTTAFIKAEEEKLDKFAASRGYSRPEGAARRQPTPAAETSTEGDEANVKPISPSSSSLPKMAGRQFLSQEEANRAKNGWASDI